MDTYASVWRASFVRKMRNIELVAKLVFGNVAVHKIRCAKSKQ